MSCGSKEQLRRFAPSALFGCLLILINSFSSNPFKFWVVKGDTKTKTFNDLSFIFGPFFAAILWVLRLTHGKFKTYLLLNAVMDVVLAYPMTIFFEKLGIYKLVNFKQKHLFFTSFSIAVLIYKFHEFIIKPKDAFLIREGKCLKR